MVVGAKLVEGDCMGKMISISKKALLISLVFMIVSVYAQEENISELPEGIPVEKLGISIEDLLKDPLRDVPILNEDAEEVAQSGIGSDQKPLESKLQVYTEKNETGEGETYLVWNLTFGEPDYKEVLVDATNREIISIKSVTKMRGLNNIYLISSMTIVILVILIVVFLIRRTKVKNASYKSWEELNIK